MSAELRGGGAAARLSCDEVRDLAPAFVLGALERDAEAAVRSHLETCPEVHQELEQLGGPVGALSVAATPLEPAATLRARILDAAAAEPRSAPAVDRARVESAPARPSVPAVPIARRRRWRDASPFTWALRAAAVLVIVALGAWNLGLRQEATGLDRFRSAVAAVAEAGTQPGSLTAVLAGGESAGSAGRGVGAVRADGTVLLAVSGLAPTSGSQVYEAWIVPGGAGAAPVPVGSFTVGGDGTGVLEAGRGPVIDGSLLALTREPGPGATTPTLPIVSSGAAKRASA